MFREFETVCGRLTHHSGHWRKTFAPYEVDTVAILLCMHDDNKYILNLLFPFNF